VIVLPAGPEGKGLLEVARRWTSTWMLSSALWVRAEDVPNKVDDLVKALGVDMGISKSEVSRICQGLDEEISAFRDRSLAEVEYPYVFLDATYCKARVNHRVVSQAIVVAMGVSSDGLHKHREVLGMDVGDSEDGAFWTALLRGLKARGLHGVGLVISDAHAGLKRAIAAVFQGSSWQRCRVHFMRNVLSALVNGWYLVSPQRSATSKLPLSESKRITKALRINRPRVGAWESASAVGSAVEQNTPVMPLAKPSPEPPSR